MKVLINERLSRHKMKTKEGYLICSDAVLARTGKQTYRKSELFGDSAGDEEIEIDRLPEDVFAETTLASFENKPITIEHPSVDVNTENYHDYAVGFVRDVRKGKDGNSDVIVGDLVFTDQRAIDLIESGEMTELSCGYDCSITQDEHPRQVNILGNHVALCRQGRAGNARIVDTIDDAQTINYEGYELIKQKDGSWLLVETYEYFKTKEEAMKAVRRYIKADSPMVDDANKKLEHIIEYFDVWGYPSRSELQEAVDFYKMSKSDVEHVFGKKYDKSELAKLHTHDSVDDAIVVTPELEKKLQGMAYAMNPRGYCFTILDKVCYGSKDTKTWYAGQIRTVSGDGKRQTHMLCRVVIDGVDTTTDYARALYAAETGKIVLADVEIDHLDGDHSNNSISNMELVDRNENQHRSNARVYARALMKKYGAVSTREITKEFGRKIADLLVKHNGFDNFQFADSVNDNYLGVLPKERRYKYQGYVIIDKGYSSAPVVIEGYPYAKDFRTVEEAKQFIRNGMHDSIRTIKDYANGFAVVKTKDWWTKGLSAYVEAWFGDKADAMRTRDSLILNDGIDFDVVDCANKRRIIDSVHDVAIGDANKVDFVKEALRDYTMLFLPTPPNWSMHVSSTPQGIEVFIGNTSVVGIDPADAKRFDSFKDLEMYNLLKLLNSRSTKYEFFGKSKQAASKYDKLRNRGLVGYTFRIDAKAKKVDDSVAEYHEEDKQNMHDKSPDDKINQFLDKLEKTVPYATYVSPVSHTGVSVNFKSRVDLEKGIAALEKAGYDVENWDEATGSHYNEAMVWSRTVTFDSVDCETIEDADDNAVLQSIEKILKSIKLTDLRKEYERNNRTGKPEEVALPSIDNAYDALTDKPEIIHTKYGSSLQMNFKLHNGYVDQIARILKQRLQSTIPFKNIDTTRSMMFVELKDAVVEDTLSPEIQNAIKRGKLHQFPFNGMYGMTVERSDIERYKKELEAAGYRFRWFGSSSFAQYNFFFEDSVNCEDSIFERIHEFEIELERNGIDYTYRGCGLYSCSPSDISKVRKIAKANYVKIRVDASGSGCFNVVDSIDDAIPSSQKVVAEVKQAGEAWMKKRFGDEWKDFMFGVSADSEDGQLVVHVWAELTYKSLDELSEELDKVIRKYDKDAYFDHETSGRLIAWLNVEVNDSCEDSVHDDRLSPMTYAKLKELGYNSDDWKDLTQEQANEIVRKGKKSGEKPEGKPEEKPEGKSKSKFSEVTLKPSKHLEENTIEKINGEDGGVYVTSGGHTPYIYGNEKTLEALKEAGFEKCEVVKEGRSKYIHFDLDELNEYRKAHGQPSVEEQRQEELQTRFDDLSEQKIESPKYGQTRPREQQKGLREAYNKTKDLAKSIGCYAEFDSISWDSPSWSKEYDSKLVIQKAMGKGRASVFIKYDADGNVTDYRIFSKQLVNWEHGGGHTWATELSEDELNKIDELMKKMSKKTKSTEDSVYDEKNEVYSHRLSERLKKAGLKVEEKFAAPWYRGPAFVWINFNGDIKKAKEIAEQFAKEISTSYFRVRVELPYDNEIRLLHDSIKPHDSIVVRKSSGEKFKVLKVPGDGYVYLASIFDSRIIKTVEDSFKEKYAPEAPKKKLKTK